MNDRFWKNAMASLTIQGREYWLERLSPTIMWTNLRSSGTVYVPTRTKRKMKRVGIARPIDEILGVK